MLRVLFTVLLCLGSFVAGEVAAHYRSSDEVKALGWRARVLELEIERLEVRVQGLERQAAELKVLAYRFISPNAL